MQTQHKTLIFSTLFGSCLVMIFTLIPVWQLILIPTIIMGILNKRFRNAIIAGVSSVLIAWSIYIIFGMATRNVYGILDQIGGLIFGEGFALIFLLMIYMSGIIFGILGSALGNRLYFLISNFFKKKEERSESSRE